MPLPAWIAPDAAKIREETDVQPHELFTLAPDATETEIERFERIIRGHIETQSAYVWGEMQAVTKPRAFPSTKAELEIAYPYEPLVLVRPVVLTPEIVAALDAEVAAHRAEYDADHALIIEAQRANAQLAVKSLVIAKLQYSVSGEEAKERAKNDYITAQTLLGSLKRSLKRIKGAYRMATAEPLA